ncbi:MAG: CPBP family intramembrane glutamic endopeptidase [Pseudomonadota bacterium]
MMHSNARGRLQRGPSASGYRVATFADVFKRHGLTMSSLALLCLLLPTSWSLLGNTTAPALNNPMPYLAALTGLLLFFTYWSRRHGLTATQQVPWLTYLLLISVVEELTFRLVLPQLLSSYLDNRLAHVLSNIVFACIHYVTLRWRTVNCVATFFGGMGLSHLMGRGDLLLVILIHWLGTFINTPSPPSGDSDGAG